MPTFNADNNKLKHIDQRCTFYKFWKIWPWDRKL